MAGTSFKQEAEALIEHTNKAIDVTLGGWIADIASKAISQSVFENVYPLYTPKVYVRRRMAGGLPHPQSYQYVQYSGGDIHALIVRDDRPEVARVENGFNAGKHHNVPIPARPYFGTAQEDFDTNPDVEKALQAAMNSIP